VRGEWDELMAEFERDENNAHFRQDESFQSEVKQLPPALEEEFLEFMVSSVTAEFSGCVLYNEIKRRATNPEVQKVMGYMARDEARHAGFINKSLKDLGVGVDLGFLKKREEIYLLSPEVHLLRDLFVREDRLRPLHHHLPPSGAASGTSLPSHLSLVRRMVQRRVSSW
jgi:magnesium-protoporphyrin IX monomethyl ester (oxidative) cyclase